jgi:hypothetical protein
MSSKKPKDTAFRQQRLKAFIPVHTAKSSAVIFFLGSMIFFVFGIMLYVENNNQTEVWFRYDDKCDIYKELNIECKITFQVQEDLKKPVFIYYELLNFYQNHRLYVKSKSYKQLRGDSPSSTDLKNCEPARYNKDFKGYYSGKTLEPDDTARPCGLIARSVFNDSIRIENYEIDSSDIASDTEKKMYKSKDPSKEWTDMDQHFANWMKIATLPNFRKFYGKIDEDVNKGEKTFYVWDRFNVEKWDGEKRIVLSTAGRFGGKNTVLGTVLIVAGVFCFLCSLVFTAAALFVKQKWMNQDPRSWRFK